ncbi:hypothetical protein [Pelagibius sp. Alg239-R121]|uniref:hypothetical protein n=1 Tax=Pelagibius sp. Alg239-R121 TaxID=2993448 RepID=UPI0024A6EF61|nr:hypothetical protein [Pelagibius sp. Alg239-R121]
MTADRMAQAFPLVQLVNPNLSFEGWQRYAAYRTQSDVKEPSGILLIEDGSEHIAGLFGYLIDLHLQYGRVLVARDLVTLALFEHQRNQALRTIVETLDELAATHSCSAIHTITAKPLSCEDTNVPFVQLFAAAGHRCEPWGFCKLLPPAAV